MRLQEGTSRSVRTTISPARSRKMKWTMPYCLRKMKKAINTTPDGLAYAIKASYFKNASLTTLTGGADISLARESWNTVRILGSYSPTSQLGGRVFSADGIAPSIMAGTHGYGFGCVLVYEEDSD